MKQIWRTYEEMDEVIYAADMDTYELIYLNKRARELYGIQSMDQIQGKKCYEVLQKNSVPCVMCTNDKIENGEKYRWEYFNQLLRNRFVLTDQMIVDGGRRIRLEIAREVSEESENHRYHGIDGISVLINECMRMSLEKTDPDQGIRQMMEYLGLTLLGERVYIFELSESNEWNNTYEWCAYNVTAEIANLKNIPYDTTEIWNQEFEQDNFVVIPEVEEIKESDPEVYDYLKPQDIHSIIVGPLYRDNKLSGFYGIDNPPRETIEKVASMLKTIGHVIDSLIEKRELVKKLEELSYHDQMSQMGNRFALEKQLKLLDYNQSVGIAYCDVTGLKRVNDTLGHAAGDRMLLQACACMEEAFAGYELFRIGGDELLALAGGIGREQFEQNCEKLKELMFRKGLHLAIGPVWRSRVDVNPRELIEQADALMYADKKAYYDAWNNENSEQECIDSLTGGYTRKGFIRETEKILTHSPLEKKYALIAIDIQKFKSINDIFGLGGGDKLLLYLYQLLKRDTERIRIVGRLEADWFICLMDREKLELNKFEKTMNFSWSYEGRTVQISLHSGIYLVEDRSIPVNSMIEWAIMAKQSTQKESIHPFAIFDERMRQDYVSKAEILSSFQRGLREEEFKVYYQPIIQLTTNHVVAAEALVRWQHGQLGFISPAQFIPVLESNGMITELDNYVLKKVNDYLERISQSNLPVFSLAVNLSWQDFYDQKMVDDVIQIASAHSNRDRRVNFEVTETSLAALEQNCGYILKQFQECGSRVFLDDFGSGVSSLGMIGNYSFDIIKIDRSFICQIESNATMRSIIQSVVQMCHNIGLKVVGEGAETKAEIDFLREVNCDYVQGFYYAKPMPEEEFNRYVFEHGSIDYTDKKVQMAIARMNQPVLNEEFYKKLLDRVDKFISVVNPEDYSVIYLNETAQKAKGGYYQGGKCYYQMERLDKPCGHCVMKNLQYDRERKLTVGSGANLLDVTASMWEINGKKVFVEIGEPQNPEEGIREYITQMKSIIEMLPNKKLVFLMDVTEDRLISFSGTREITRNLKEGTGIDSLIHRIASFAPDCKMQKEFFDTFGREALQSAYECGNYQYSKDIVSCCGEDGMRQIRVSANLIFNPDTAHIECILYGIEITEDETAAAEEILDDHFFRMYQKADHDRRIDYLTGLRNRLDLNTQFSVIGEEDEDSVKTVYMIDIDDFKKINDQYGHQIGDRCLETFGEFLKQYGMEHGITFFRYGGEEVLGIDIGNHTDAEVVSEDLLQMIRNLEIATDTGEKIGLTVSIGYANQKNTLKKLIEYADKAMYVAKKRGKDCFSAYEKMK